MRFRQELYAYFISYFTLTCLFVCLPLYPYLSYCFSLSVSLSHFLSLSFSLYHSLYHYLLYRLYNSCIFHSSPCSIHTVGLLWLWREDSSVGFCHLRNIYVSGMFRETQSLRCLFAIFPCVLSYLNNFFYFYHLYVSMQKWYSNNNIFFTIISQVYISVSYVQLVWTHGVRNK